MSDLKMGRSKSLSAETLSKVAYFFGVYINYLLGKEHQKEKAPAEAEAKNTNVIKMIGYRSSCRTNPLSDLAIKTFANIKPKSATKDNYIFPLPNGNLQTPNTWSQKLQRFMIEAAKAKRVPELTAHELRHTYGTKLRRSGIDIYTIQKVMGHKDIKVTSEIYVHNELEVLRKALKKAPSKDKKSQKNKIHPVE